MSADLAGICRNCPLVWERVCSPLGHDLDLTLVARTVFYALFEMPSNIVCSESRVLRNRERCIAQNLSARCRRVDGRSHLDPASNLPFWDHYALHRFHTEFWPAHRGSRSSGCVPSSHLLLELRSCASSLVHTGLAEAGVLPALAFVLSRFYKPDELVLRIAFCVSAAALAGGFGGLLASGFISIGEIGSLGVEWRNIFLFEGLITLVVGVLCACFAVSGPSDAWWLTAEERGTLRSLPGNTL